jgi:hypothetical protein
MTIDIRTAQPGDALSWLEHDLYELLMEYRASEGLDPIPLSKALTATAGRHAADTMYNIWDAGVRLPAGANLHSWSDAAYYADHRYPERVWDAPARIGIEYPSAGYEISAAGYRTIEAALDGWKGSPGHNGVILNLGPWSDVEFKAIGVGIEIDADVSSPYGGPEYGVPSTIFHVWFGESEDPARFHQRPDPILEGADGRTIDPVAGEREPGGGGPRSAAGTGGDDDLVGDEEADTIEGGPGADRITGLSGADHLSGGSGDDRIWGGHGSDRIDGGSGDDDLEGGRGRDTISAGSGDDRVLGQQSADTILGMSGNDLIEAGSGADVVEAGSGDDRVLGGSGGDRIEGGSGGDRIVAGSGSDVIEAGSGNDVIEGNSGRDRILAGSGRDELYGDSGDDVLHGGSGDDLISGGPGSDRLTGGSGADAFVFARGDDRAVITDFTPGADEIWLEGFDGVMGGMALAPRQRGDDVVFDLGGDTLVVEDARAAAVWEASYVVL